MANTTFTGPVRSENGFIGASKNATTGVYTNNFKVDASGVYTGTLMQPMGTVTTAKVNSSAGTNEVTFSQPAKTIITSIQLVCTSAPTVASGDIGYKVGTATNATVTLAQKGVLDGGTTVAAGAHYSLTLLDTTASDASPAASPRVNTGTSARNIFLQITNTTTASDQGGFTWIVAYKQYA